MQQQHAWLHLAVVVVLVAAESLLLVVDGDVENRGVGSMDGVDGHDGDEGGVGGEDDHGGVDVGGASVLDLRDDDGDDDGDEAQSQTQPSHQHGHLHLPLHPPWLVVVASPPLAFLASLALLRLSQSVKLWLHLLLPPPRGWWWQSWRPQRATHKFLRASWCSERELRSTPPACHS